MSSNEVVVHASLAATNLNCRRAGAISASTSCRLTSQTFLVLYRIHWPTDCDMLNALFSVCVARFWWHCQKFSFRDVSDCDFWRAAKTGGSRTGVLFWQAAKTGDRRTGVTFGTQPTQVFGRPCRRTQRVIAPRMNF